MRRELGVVVLACLGAVPLAATVVVPAEFRETVADAGLIVRGSVTDVRAVVVPDDGVDSVATVVVEAVLKGPASTFVSVRVPGGVSGRYRVVMVGAPTLHLNDRAVFFLRRGSDNAWRPVGLSAGIARIERDRTTGQSTVRPPILVGRTASPGLIVRGDVRRTPMTVDEFDSLVRVVMLAQEGQGSARPE